MRSLANCLGVYVPLGTLVIFIVCIRCPFVVMFMIALWTVATAAMCTSVLLAPAFNSGLIESVRKQVTVFTVVAFAFQAALTVLFASRLDF